MLLCGTLTCLAAAAQAQVCEPRWSDRFPFGGMGQPPLFTAVPQVDAIATHDDGSGPVLYAGGEFNSVRGIQTGSLARRDGQEWSAVGGVQFPGYVFSLSVFDDGSGPVTCPRFLYQVL